MNKLENNAACKSDDIFNKVENVIIKLIFLSASLLVIGNIINLFV